jgi:uncharacterized protein YjcR
MKKEARLLAEKMFLKHGGKITNRDIADAVKVNALTVGRWKRYDDWEGKLKGIEEAAAKEAAPVTVRKKAARDKAVKLYLDAGGNITNKDLAMKAGVSPATISKWKEQDDWMALLEEPAPQEASIEEPEPEAEVQEPAKEESYVQPEIQEEPELDVGELASPEQIIEINRRIDDLLKRDYLTASELADVAAAKSDLLEAVQTYLAIVREVGEMSIEG